MPQYEPRHLKPAVDFAEPTRHRYPYDRFTAFQFPLTDINRAFEEQNTGRIPRAPPFPWD